MQYMFYTGIIIVVILTGVWLFGPRLVKTLFLITRIAPYERQLPDAPRILLLGDSTGYGTGATAARYSVAGRIGQDFPQYTIINESKNGRTIGELLPVAKKIDGSYELILLQIGGNDILDKRNPDTVEAELRQVVATLAPRTEALVMISTGNVGGASAFRGAQAATYESLTRTFRERFVAVADDTSLVYVDLFEEPANDVFVKEPKTYLALDGLHPSNAGYGEWYKKLKPTLWEILTENRTEY